ncbi:MAG: hypothetical protein K2G13_04985, partial [Muribaculaceae bacterium]|nr:hypothetical protein [Muribaculaceae bacterium]
FTFNLLGIDTWCQGYTLAIAGFEDGNDYALISKNLDTSVTDGICDISLSGIPLNVDRIELCALDRLRRRVATFSAAAYSPQSEQVVIDLPETDISMANAIQVEIFNTTCIQCHGGTGYSAAGLNLISGNSFQNLISVQARKIQGMDRVTPGESTESELFQILNTDISSDWNYDHSVEVVRQEKLDLIRNWIDNGAKVAYMK